MNIAVQQSNSRSVVLTCIAALTFLATGSSASVSWGEVRQWSDPTGNFKVEAELLTANEDVVVLETAGQGELIAVRRDQLSESDQRYLLTVLSKERGDIEVAELPASDLHRHDSVWHLDDGEIIKGRLMGFGTQKLIVKRERGDVVVNNRPLEELPAAYRKIVPNVVSHIDGKRIETITELEDHLAQLGGGPFTYTVTGVQIDLENWGAITIPLSLLDPKEAEQVQPGFERWKAAREDDVSDEDRAQTDSYERLVLDSMERYRRKQAIRNQQLKMMQLQLLGVNAGVTDVWEVTIYPSNGYGYPNTVAVFAENSLQASQIVAQRYPGWRIGGIARASY